MLMLLIPDMLQMFSTTENMVIKMYLEDRIRYLNFWVLDCCQNKEAASPWRLMSH